MEIKTYNSGLINQPIKDIRKKVFCDEQGYSYDNEFDSLDGEAYFILINQNDTFIATGRTVNMGDDIYRIGRIAVIKEYRGRGVGKVLVTNLIDFSRKLGAKKIILGAQEHAIGFYETLGFRICGAKYLEEEKSHYPMEIKTC